MWIACGTTTFLCKVKSHRGGPFSEVVDDLVDLGRTMVPEHTVWTGIFMDRWTETQTHVNL